MTFLRREIKSKQENSETTWQQQTKESSRWNVATFDFC